MTFKELGLNDNILSSLQKKQFTEPTEIQEKSIPIFLNNQNVFGKSSTGTGKTASFVLPILQKIDLKSKNQQALIVVPTRELALQIMDQIRILSSTLENLNVAAVIGGARLSDQIKKLKRSQIIVGTPGRINDHLQRKTLKLNHLKMVILDEADEMLKMGFKNELDKIFELVNDDVQVGLFSATVSPKTLQLANNYMKKYELVEVQNQVMINQNIKNTYTITKGYTKEDVLFSFIEKHEMKKFIIFTNTKSNCKQIAKFLTQKNVNNQIINGDLKQSQRTRVIKEFKDGKFQALIATDVVARGIHIDDVDYVINFELPIDDEYFVHRIGRTGRNNHQGSTITLVNSYKLIQRLKFIIKKYDLEINEEFVDTNLEKTQFEAPKKFNNYNSADKYKGSNKYKGNDKYNRSNKYSSSNHGKSSKSRSARHY